MTFFSRRPQYTR